MEKPPSSHLTVATQSGEIRGGKPLFYFTMLYSPSWDNITLKIGSKNVKSKEGREV
jgi:hypothetical protein